MSSSTLATVPRPPAGRIPPAVPEERIHGLDSLRAVAMFLGIALHGALSFLSIDVIAPWPVRDVERHVGFNVLALFIHGFRMQLFFLLAGFFARLLHARLGAKAFVKQRLLRIGLPFLVGPVICLLPFLLVMLWGARWLDDPSVLNLQPPRNAGPPTGHLWFLEFLLLHYAAAVLVVPLLARVPAHAAAVADGIFERAMRSPLRVVVFVPLTVLCLWNGPAWGEAHNAGVQFVPEGRAVAHYGVFFAVGWWLHRRRGLLAELRRFIGPSVVVGIVLLLVHARILQTRPVPAQPDYTLLKITSLACVGVYAWAMTFALTGLFLRLAGQARPWVRYLADASYWCYLAHPALVLFLQVLFAKWRWAASLKFALLLAITMAVLLLSYEWFVRYTWIGTVLNGKRERP